MLDFRKLRTYVMLDYTEEGRAIVCITPDGEGYKSFYSKQECAKYIRKNHGINGRIYLLKRLKSLKGKPFRDKVKNTHFKKGIAYVGLCDVTGGKMWHCITSVSNHTPIYFCYKRDVVKYINNNFEGEDKKYLIAQLNSFKGQRAYTLNR